jgi:glutathione S-transferase
VDSAGSALDTDRVGLNHRGMSQPVLFGASYSVYVRAARLALIEKGVSHRLVEVDIFAEGGPPADYLARQPFRRIPALEHDGFRLYETGAITRYVDEAFDGPALMPGDARRRARANQILSILDSYLYRPLVRDIYVQRCLRPSEGRPTDEAVIAAALPAARTCLTALEEIFVDDAFATGPELSLADLHLAAMAAYFTRAREAIELLGDCPRLTRWWSSIRVRPSLAATRFPGEIE